VNVCSSVPGQERAPVAAGNEVGVVAVELVVVGTVEVITMEELVTVLPLYGRPKVELSA
jgi:hypothetical protein